MDATFMADVAIAMQASADAPIFRCLAINFFSNRVVPARERSLDMGLWVRSCDVDLLVMYITASVACGRRGMSVVHRRFGEISNDPETLRMARMRSYMLWVMTLQTPRHGWSAVWAGPSAAR